tara:strand:- start:28 stop:981 length:954 start_codon:yes stop_codon:yes gene_type:complete
MANLGKITKIPIRDEFPHEAHNFTPWLRENLSYVEEKLHIKFEEDEIETEVNVGPYSCDVLAPTKDGRKVVIENQFNRADHDHLGKMITYAAGLKADVLVWIAETFRDEEIATLNWLNEMSTNEYPAFFAIQVELIKIGDSLPALNLDVVVQPDIWSDKVDRDRITSRANKKGDTYENFWSDFIEYFSKERDELKNRKAPRTNYLNISAKNKKFNFTFMFKIKNVPALQLWIEQGSKERNEDIFNQIKSHEKEIEKILPGLLWLNDTNLENIHKKIVLSRDETYDFSGDNEEDVFEWFVNYMSKFEKAFNPILENLN